MDQRQQLLQEIFGYPQFRPGQEPLIDSLLSGRDAVGIMPTGAGKSICYQLPALLLPGITVVVSPLISLMKDQVSALVQAGVRAAYINSSLTESQCRKAMENARGGMYKIIYVAPERLLTPGFLALGQFQAINMVCVDEAHCVSQWGQDFRPSYLDIPKYLDTLPARPVVGAFTATATEEVRGDIVELLGLREPEILVTGFDRPNLYFEVQAPGDKYAALKEYLFSHPDRSGIVYCLTRKTVEEVTARLCADGFAAARYHAGLDPAERRDNQDDFLYDRARIMVATNAFGMGIDKSNVSFVIHYNMPKNIESYYQEAGRAGRDGEAADCILLYSGRDVITNQFLIDHGEGKAELTEEQQLQLREKDKARLRQMTFYATTRGCLREFILKYFGERPASYCGNCSGCLSNFEEVDATAAAVLALGAVQASRRRYGVKTWVDALRGSKNEKTRRFGLTETTEYGALAEWSETRVRELFSLLLSDGLLYQTEEEYAVLALTPEGAAFLAEPSSLIMKCVRPRAAAPRSAPLREVDESLYAELKALRLTAARRAGVPAFVIFTDATLQKMCQLMPCDEAEFLKVPGVGRTKCERYAGEFLAAIRSYQERQKQPQ
ncbi:DNA helicase RecQ [Anaerofilum sp. BX8]|uniref:DNA helicase RecQ n=1 Tax=Anaerofilum hominis TaxID=2763016 RepID=A0A923I9A4_9FIRM|nr:DNA helicase RecQ [Anaerofilum hominis]MBC5582229.1 DNA helicase RecQ [Anaerofilum hominis]